MDDCETRSVKRPYNSMQASDGYPVGTDLQILAILAYREEVRIALRYSSTIDDIGVHVLNGVPKVRDRTCRRLR